MLWLVLGCQNETPKSQDSDNVIDSASSDTADQYVPFDCSEVYEQLTVGVETLELGDSLPSDFVLLNTTACPIIWDEAYRSYGVSAEYGLGHILFLGHEGMLGPSENNQGGQQLIQNALGWSSASERPNVAFLQENGSAQAAVELAGAVVVDLDLGDMSSLDILVMNPYDRLDGITQEAILDFVRSGGGLLVGGHAWWWAYSNPGLSVGVDYPSAWLAQEVGVQWTSNTDVSAGSETISADPPTELQHAVYALQQLSNHLDNATLNTEDIALGTFTVGRAIDAVPLSNSDFFDPARAFSAEVGPIQPTAEAPLRPAEQPVEVLSARIEFVLATKDTPENTEAHPAAEDFPGFPTGATACRDHAITIDASYVGRDPEYVYAGSSSWVARSTGVYALPGAPLDIVVSQAAVDAGLEVAIGSHSDALWGKEEIVRFPELVRREPITETEFRIASGFGGLVYIWVPSSSPLGEIEVVLSGGVFAPQYIHGETTLDEWLTEQRGQPAPFGELHTDGLILTLPSDQLATLDDPIALMDYYSDVASKNIALEGRNSADRVRSEWIVFDRQISAGWMHSGYPVMAHLESVSNVLSLSSMQTTGDWGVFHELGHNHQWQDWILPGTTETTCNLWSVYVMETVVGIGTDGHSALTPESREERMTDYLNSGASFDDWSVWVALESYLQLQEAFGWSIYPNIFQRYRELDNNSRPGTDQERIDMWVQFSSEEVGFDLSPFYLSWGLPVSQETVNSTSALPEWSENPME